MLPPMSEPTYYLDIDGKTAGPFTIEEVRILYLDHKITDQTLYARPGAVDWLPLSTIIALIASVDTTRPNFYPPPTPPALQPPQQVVVVASHESPASRGVYIVLGLFFGGIGIHNFYAGRSVAGVLQILIVLCSCGWGLLLTIPWSIIDIIVINKDGQGRMLR